MTLWRARRASRRSAGSLHRDIGGAIIHRDGAQGTCPHAGCSRRPAQGPRESPRRELQSLGRRVAGGSNRLRSSGSVGSVTGTDLFFSPVFSGAGTPFVSVSPMPSTLLHIGAGGCIRPVNAGVPVCMGMQWDASPDRRFGSCREQIGSSIHPISGAKHVAPTRRVRGRFPGLRSSRLRFPHSPCFPETEDASWIS